MKKIFVSSSLSVLMLLLCLAGCGGGSSSSGSGDSASILLHGVVEDGPVENSKVSLRSRDKTIATLCGSRGGARCETISDAGGAFTLEVPAGTDLSGLAVHAVGGVDRATGMDFTGVEMRSPLTLFPDASAELVISPLTTLVAEVEDRGLALDSAQSRLREWLSLPPSTDLAARPSANLDLQRRALLLSHIALGLDAVSPFAGLGAEVVRSNTALLAADGSCNQAVLSALRLEPAVQEEVAALQMTLKDAWDISEVAYLYKREELVRTFSANVELMLVDSAAFDPENSHYLANIRFLAEATLNAAGDEVITLGGTIPQRIARYILFTYRLRDWESLTLDPALFSVNLPALKDDPWVAELARSRSLYSVVSPLPLPELPGNDSALRLAYFYGSDLSPYFRAEQLIGQVFDDAINDAVLLKIIEGKAYAGLVDEVKTIIATQIVQSEPKGHAYLSLARELIKFDRLEEARNVLNLARDLYRDVLKSHNGATLTISTDVANLLATATSYRKAGDLENAESLLRDIAVLSSAILTMNPPPANIAIIYGNLITGIKNVVDAYVAAGDLGAASTLAGLMYDYSALTPKYQDNYKLRLYNLSECAKRYADLGNRAMVLAAYAEIQQLRKIEGSIEATYWTPVVTLIESLYRVGATAEAFALADTIPATTNDQSKALKLVATYEALQGNLSVAFSIVDNPVNFIKDEDRIDLLTYYTSNRPYIALSLIRAGRFGDAVLTLEKAEEILTGMTSSSNLIRISNGYCKVAELYALMGEDLKAERLLQRAQTTVIDDPYRVTALIDIALGYNNIHQAGVALMLLDSAKSLADSDPTRFRANTAANLSVPEYATQLYEKLLSAYEEVGDKGRLRTAILAFQAWVQQIHTDGAVADKFAIKEYSYLLRAAHYFHRSDYHEEALRAVNAAKEIAVAKIAVATDRLAGCLNVVAAYAAIHEYDKALSLAMSLEFTSERNQAIQTLANAYINRNDFPKSLVASIDSDGDGKPDFFHPLASDEEIAASGLLLDDDSDGDGIIDTRDHRPLFAD